MHLIVLFLLVPSKTISYWTDYASKILCKDVLEIEKYDPFCCFSVNVF